MRTSHSFFDDTMRLQSHASSTASLLALSGNLCLRIDTPGYRPSAQAPQEGVTSEAPAVQRLSVLVVDRNPDAVTIHKRRLTKHLPVHVLSASSGAECLEIV